MKLRLSVSNLIYLPMALALGMFLFLAFGCTSSTEPTVDPSDLTFQYLPDAGVVDFFPLEELEFSLISNPSVSLQYQWNLNGVAQEGAGSYLYHAARVGVDTIRVEFSYSGVTWNRTWYGNVSANPSAAPPPVPQVLVEHAYQSGAVDLSWIWVSNSFYPIEEYQMAMSYEGPISVENWDEAIMLGSVESVPNQVGYSVNLSHEGDGLLPGELVWFSVRAMDNVGQLSSLNDSPSIRVSTPWYIEGYVYSDALEPLANVIIDYGSPDSRVNTDTNGFYSIGPLPNVNVYDLTTHSRNEPEPGFPLDIWYDYTFRELTYQEGQTYDLVILTRYGLDESCGIFDHDFMAYFQDMTSTTQETNLRPNRLLYHWEEYPLSVYIPPFTNEHGFDYQQLCTEVVGYWNLAMDEEYFYLVDTAAEADVEFYFGNESIHYAGRAFIDLPDDENYRLGDVIPERMKVYVWDQLNQEIFVQETAMHELGHVLGITSHTICSGDGFLMSNNSSGILDNGPLNAIHIDEKRTFRAIRNLPQGTNMADFIVE